MSLEPSGLPAVQDDEKTMAMIAHLCIFLQPVLGPLALLGPVALYFTRKDTSPFIAYHAMQALIFQIGFMVLMFVGLVLGNIVIGIFAAITLGLGGICYFVLCALPLPIFLAIPYALKAKNGDWAGYPIIGGMGLPAGVS